MKETSEIQELEKRLTAIEQAYATLKMWAAVIAACIAGMFGLSLFQVPKTIKETVEKSAAGQTAQEFQRAINEAKNNADLAAEGAKTSQKNARAAEEAATNLKSKWELELKAATNAINQTRMQLAAFQRAHATQVEQLEADNKILMGNLAIQFFESILALVPKDDSSRPRIEKQLADARQKVADFEKDAAAISARGRSARDRRPQR